MLDSICVMIAMILTAYRRWFENVTLANRGCGGGIVAWQGDTTPGNTFGAYISNSQVIRVSGYIPPQERVALMVFLYSRRTQMPR